MDIATIAITAAITLIVTVIGGLAVEYLKKIRPKLEYSVKEAIPIQLDEKMIGANVVYIANPSSNPVKDITVKIKAVGHEVKNGGIKSTKGLEYSVKEEGDSLQITFPFLKYKDYLAITSIVEGRYGIPREPEVTVRSPDTYTLINVGEQSERSSAFRLSFSGTLLPSFVAAVVVGSSLGLSSGPAGLFVRSDQGINLALAAAVSGLPLVAERYTSNDGVYYYNQGPYIYSLAKSSSSKEEIRRLRDFLCGVIINTQRMSDTSWPVPSLKDTLLRCFNQTGGRKW